MTDMDTAYLVDAPHREVTVRYHHGRERRLLVIEHEVPYPDGKLIVSRTDPQGLITHANQAFVDMSGYEREELIGEPHCILRHPDMPAAAFKDLWDTVARGDKWQGYVKNLRKDGACYWVLATAIPNVRNGKVVGYTSVRRKPSRAKVNECIALYARLRAEELAAS
ncbi:aerotaxis receptor [Sphaerotilus hippei]|uniref:Aerotaxis receptor n=1 Tax=Sphaerotilus hippei TaxID=744406 RepID=A0A318GXX9_9BURK|nr:PAS domain-containing protein [Sphaerotilus hippei]PXW94164.1 aerotaxis receptor [Sphaerotilus hippei]